MTLQASGVISFSNINTELQRSSTSLLSLNDTNARELANKPSGIISLSDFYGKTWLTANDAATWFVNNRDTAHNWVFGGSGDTRGVNNPYARYVSSATYSRSYSFSGVTSRWVTVVFTATDNGVNSISNIQVNGVTRSPTGTAYSVYSGGVETIQVYVHVELDIKSVTSTSMTWNFNSGNAGSWASTAVLPGKWTPSGQSGGYSVADNQIVIGSGGEGGDGPYYGISSAGGMNYHNFSAWWYNCGQLFMLANVTGSSKTWSANASSMRSGLYTFVEG